MNTDLTPYEAPGILSRYDPETRLQAQRDVIKAQIMPENSSDDELEVFMATCIAQGLDPFMGQIIAIRPDAKTKDGKPTGPVKPFRTWEGLVAIAERTGEYQGRVGPLWTGDGKEWVEVWLDEENAPKAAKVGVWRKGYREPTWGIATLAAWGMQEEYDDERDKQGKPVVRQGKYGTYTKRVKTGNRTLKPGWWEMPQTPHQLAKVAFTIALKSTFQPQMLRRATRAIDGEVIDGALPASRDQVVRLHASTPPSLQGSRNRQHRLEVAGMYFRRPVHSYNDLSSDEASELADWFDQVGEDYEEIVDVEVETDADVDYTEALEASIAQVSAGKVAGDSRAQEPAAAEVHQAAAPAAQAGPLSPPRVGPADSSAGVRTKQGTHEPTGTTGHEAHVASPGRSPAEPPSDKAPADSEPSEQPGGEAGKAAAVTQNMTGTAAAPARPRRQPAKAKEQKLTPIQAMPPTFRRYMMEHFEGDLTEATRIVDEHIARWSEAKSWPATGGDAPWSLALLAELAAATFEKGKQP